MHDWGIVVLENPFSWGTSLRLVPGLQINKAGRDHVGSTLTHSLPFLFDNPNLPIMRHKSFGLLTVPSCSLPL